MLTVVPCPGADHIDAWPPQSAVRSTIDRRTPSRARSTRAGSNPVPRSRTVTRSRPGAARRRGVPLLPGGVPLLPRLPPRRRPGLVRPGQVDLNPGVRSPRVRGYVRQRLARGVRDRRGDRCRDGRRPVPGDLDVDVQPAGAHLGGDRLDACDQVAAGCGRCPRRRRPGRSGVLVVGVAEGGLDQGHVPAAPAHYLGHVLAVGAGQGGERVEHRVVQQPLVLAALDIHRQDDVLFAGGPVGLVQGGVGRDRAAVEFPAAVAVDACDHDQQAHRRHHRPDARACRLSADPVGHRRNDRQRHPVDGGCVPCGNQELARHADHQPAERGAADGRRHEPLAAEREGQVNGGVRAREKRSGRVSMQVGNYRCGPRHGRGGAGEAPWMGRIKRVPDGYLHRDVRDCRTSDYQCKAAHDRPQGRRRRARRHCLVIVGDPPPR